MLRRNNSFPQEVSMFSLINLFLSHRRQLAAEQVAAPVALANVRTVANDRGLGLARAA